MAATTGNKFVADITPASERHWAVIVRVLEKSFPRASEKTSQLQRLILIDKQGTKVQATIFGAAIRHFAHTLIPLRKYEIRNAKVSPIAKQFRIVPHDYQWIINESCPVTELPLNAEDEIPVSFNFMSFTDMSGHIGREIDILGAILTSRPVKTINGKPVQEFVIMNEELKLLLFTTWDQIVPNEAACIMEQIESQPVIIATCIKVKAFNGLSLGTTPTSTFIISHDLPEVAALRTWISENQHTISEIIDREEYLVVPAALAASSSASPTVHHEIISIKDIPSAPTKGQIFTIQGRASVTNNRQKFIYTCCNKCLKTINAPHGSQYSCHSCSEKDATPSTAILRCCIECQLEDTSGKITATTFGKIAETLFSVTALKLYENTREDGTVNTECVDLHSSNKEQVFVVKANYRAYQQQETLRFVVLSITDPTDATVKSLTQQ